MPGSSGAPRCHGANAGLRQHMSGRHLVAPCTSALPLAPPLQPLSAAGRLAVTAGSPSSCDRQHELAAVPLALGVIVEEIGVEHRLHKAPSPADPIDVVVHEVAVYPIQDVERAVRPHRAHKVRREILDLADLLQEHQLRQDGYTLQPDGRRPQDVRDRVLLRAKDAEKCAGPQQVELVLEGVVAPLIGLGDGNLKPHEVDKVEGGRDEDKLHHCVVDRDEAP
mmetsp:Transcript_20885/g.47057  ORF Transcript_20885/g.47057 Transcript_20885/m.47057 type:complete len:223 (-) Transcript_20885:248-916(-)